MDKYTAIVALFTSAVMPMTITFVVMYFKSQKHNKRADLIMAAMDHGHDMKDVVKVMQEREKGVKEHQLGRLLWGCGLTLVGLVMLVSELIQRGTLKFMDDGEKLFSVIAFAVGLAFLIAFAVGQRMLKSEMEREERDAKEGKE